jgi:hypothetical protein
MPHILAGRFTPCKRNFSLAIFYLTQTGIKCVAHAARSMAGLGGQRIVPQIGSVRTPPRAWEAGGLRRVILPIRTRAGRRQRRSRRIAFCWKDKNSSRFQEGLASSARWRGKARGCGRGQKGGGTWSALARQRDQGQTRQRDQGQTRK